MRKSGLGRGLDALLPGGAVEELETRSGLREEPVGSIVPNPRQPRRVFDEGALDELAASIATLGVLQPLLVREIGYGRFELVAGERRLRAAERAGLSHVPVLVVETDDTGSLERALVENVHRQDLNPIEEAAAYRQLMEEGGLTQDALARRMGKERSTITHALRLLELPSHIQKLVIEGRLSAGHAKALLGLQGNPFQERLAQRVAHERRSVRETEELVRRYQDISGLARGKSSSAATPREVQDAQRRLADHLQTRVRVELGRRKGKVVIDFASLDELDRILRSIVSGTAAGTGAGAP